MDEKGEDEKMKYKRIRQLLTVALAATLVAGNCGTAFAETAVEPVQATAEIQTQEQTVEHVEEQAEAQGAELEEPTALAAPAPVVETAEETGRTTGKTQELELDVTLFLDKDTLEITVDGAAVQPEALRQSETDADLWYLMLTKENHQLVVNDISVFCSYDAEAAVFQMQTLLSGVTGEGTIDVEDNMADPGDETTVVVTPAAGYYLSQVRCTYEDGSRQVYEQLEGISNQGGSYVFEMPQEEALLLADFVPVTWDGTIDVNWYDKDDKDGTYEIAYAAQLAGLAAITNGLFNQYPLTTDEGGHLVPDVGEDGSVNGTTEPFYNVFASGDAATVVVGDIKKISATSDDKASGEQNETTTDVFWLGAEDFKGKTVCLTADLDMGGSYTGDRTDSANWTGPNYMPIGGAYSMTPGNGYTKISASFNGTFDGQGHMVYNLYCYRMAEDANYGDNADVGLIGRLGVHDHDDKSLYANVAVKNVAVDGNIRSRRSVGGVVGKVGKNLSACIENCLNFATVTNTDAKGCGGIVGAGWNDVVIKNCANFGYIYTTYKNAGGIVGSSEAAVTNCYNFGYVGASTASYAQAMGTNNGGASWKNCYYLKDSSADKDNPAVWGTGDKSTVYEIGTATEMKSAEFVEKINGSDREWVTSTAKNLISVNLKSALQQVYAYTAERTNYDALGVPVPRAFTSNTSRLVSITSEGAPVTSYYEGQTFQAGTFRIWANYSDETRKEITDYTIRYGTDGFATEVGLTDRIIGVSGIYEGQNYVYSWPIKTTENTVLSIEVPTMPTKNYYTTGEYFDPAGMYVYARYANGKREAVVENGVFDSTQIQFTPGLAEPLTNGVSQIAVKYTYREKTVQALVPVTVSKSGAPVVTDQVVQICSAEDFIWFVNQLKQGAMYDAVLRADIDLTGVGSWTPIGSTATTTIKYFIGTFDGNGHQITYQISDSSARYIGLFAGLGQGGTIKNLTVAGTIAEVEGTYTAGVVARMNGGTLERVTSKVQIQNCTSEYVGGIVSYVASNEGASDTISQCKNQGDLTSTGMCTGGIAGAIDESCETIQLKDCSNQGRVTAYGYAGGITGASYAQNLVIDTCKNSGEIWLGCSGSKAYAGGIAGYCESEIRGCESDCIYGVKDAVAGKTYILGGIAGWIKSAVIRDCYSKGEARLDENTRAEMICGAIFGKTNVLFPANYVVGCTTSVKHASQMSDSSYVTYIGVTRIAGETRFETCYKTADQMKESLGVDAFDTVIVADGMKFPDALTGSYLAAKKQAPILLVNGADVDSIAALHTYIKANVKTDGQIYILGGEAALPKSVVKGLESYQLIRLAGATRYETNLRILEEAGVVDEEILVCTGMDFADSLSASATGRPILLVDPNAGLTKGQADFLRKHKGNEIYIIGGSKAVSAAYEKALKAYDTNGVTRLSGATRYETSVLTAKTFFDQPDAVVAASALNFPDGLCGGPLAYVMGAPMILTSDQAPETATTYLAEQKVEAGVVLGGSAALQDQTIRMMFSLSKDAEFFLK